METLVEENKSVTIIERSIEIFKGGGQVLLSNQSRVSKALAVGENILKAVEENAGLMDDSLDARCNKYLVNCITALDEMQALRKPITQLMDNIKKMFTEEEAKLDGKKPDTVVSKIQRLRNQYAKDLLAEQERLKKDAEARAAKSHEANEIRVYIKNAITTKLLDYLASKKRQITESFNAIELHNYDDKSERLKNMNTAFPENLLGEIIRYSEPAYRLHDYTGYNTIRTDEHHQYDFKNFYKEYQRQVDELKQSLIDRLPAKKNELDQIAEQKRIREENEKMLREAKNEEEKKLAQEKQQRIEAEQKRLQEEKEKRELEEKVRLQKEEDQRKLEAEQKAELEKTTGATQIMFDQIADTASVITPAPETRNGFEITVLHPAGIAELFQFWFTREATKLSVDEMLKKSVAQMKTYAEGVAKKDDVKIDSKFLKYESAVKSVNRKTVK